MSITRNGEYMKDNMEEAPHAGETVQAEIIKTSSVREEFFPMIDYEIRPSLNTIIEMLETAMNSKDHEKTNNCINNAKDESKRLLALMDDISDIFKIEEDKLILSFHDFCFEDMLSNISIVMDTRVKVRNQRLIINVDHNIPEYVFGDKPRLMQVIINLLTYAVNFSPEEEKINFNIEKTEETGETITLRMEMVNTGNDQQKKLFSSFVETYGGASQKPGKRDLALVISKKIVEMMGGKIQIKSELDKSKMFSFTVKLKIGNKKNVIDQQNINLEDAFDFSDKIIIVADDNEIDREVLNAVLEKTKVNIEFAANGEIALSMFKRNQDKYSLILMDLHMPVMNGLEATREIRSLNTVQSVNIPIIAITAKIFKDEIKKCLDAGMNDHVGKPVDPDILYLTIQKHILSKSNTIINKVENDKN
jgi:CheY-like chemotaxis protein